MAMEMSWEFNGDGSLGRITFEGLDGSEPTGNLKSALELLKVKNPTVAFVEKVKAGAFESMPSDRYEQLVDRVGFISSLWRYPDAQEGDTPQGEMNALMLLANAVEAASRMHAMAERMERAAGEKMAASWMKEKK